MPINIYRRGSESNEKIAWLCDESWELPTQIDTLREWVFKDGEQLSKDLYVADIGYSVRPDACGGGAAIDPEMMRRMSDISVELLLSEYPYDWNEWMERKDSEDG